MHLLIPTWFYGFDSVMYLISSVMGFLISFYSHKLYCMTGKKSHYYLHLGFSLLSLGLLLVSIVSAFSYTAIRLCTSGCELSLFDLTFGVEDFGYFLYFGLSILGYILLALSYLQDKSRVPIFILGFILIFSILLVAFGTPRSELLLWYTYDQYFNLLSIALVGYILFRVLINCSKSRSTNSFLVFLAFSGVFAFHALQFFAYFNPLAYVFAHVLLIFGYSSLLAMLIKVRH